MITDKTNFFKIALIQHPPVFLNLKASLKRACDLIEEAAKEGAKVIVFPETWLPGYPVWLDFAPNAGLWEHPPQKLFTESWQKILLKFREKRCKRY